jgi:hypothetical protein
MIPAGGCGAEPQYARRPSVATRSTSSSLSRSDRKTNGEGRSGGNRARSSSDACLLRAAPAGLAHQVPSRGPTVAPYSVIFQVAR